MSRRSTRSRGDALAERLRAGRVQAERAARRGARRLPLITGVSQSCIFSVPTENVLAAARDILVQSGRVFTYGGDVVFEVEYGGMKKLVPLVSSHHVVPEASALLANLLLCETTPVGGDQPPSQFPPPQRFVELLLNSLPTLESLPHINTYATRPVFDADYNFCGPGWHPDVGILVHGPEVEPILPGPVPANAQGLCQLPRRLRGLLQDFCLRDQADRANVVAALLTCLLMPQFIQAGKPVVLLDGNQPCVGKTLLIRACGMVLDGLDPQVIHYTADDDELAKRICATLRGSSQSVVVIDNAKVRAGGSVNSPVIEANSMAAQVSLRILGQSANYTRPNDLLWAITMNDTRTSPDLVSRGLPVRFFYEGDPKQRDFRGRDPLEYAAEHRVEILGELAGMVIRWNQAGRTPGRRPHRCARWAGMIGGILEACGVDGFLANLDEAANEFNTALDELAALAEAVVTMNGPVIYSDPSDARITR